MDSEVCKSLSDLKPLYYVSILTACFGASTQFYSFGIINPEQEILTRWINEIHVKRGGKAMDSSALNVYWSIVVASISIGAIFGSLLTTVFAEKLGRRNGLIVNGFFNAVGAFLEYLSKTIESPELLIGGRFLLGACMALATGLVPMYITELTPNSLRGAAGTLHMVAVAFSDCFSLLVGMPEVLGSSSNWSIAFAIPGLPALVLCCLLPFCPESPKFTMLIRHHEEQALVDIKRIVRNNEAREMIEALHRESLYVEDSNGRAFKQIRQLRIPRIISLLVMVAQQFTGCTVVFAYSTDLFINAGFNSQFARFSTLIVGIVYFFSACSAPFLIEWIGRRKLFLMQLGCCSLALALLSIFMWIQNITKSILASCATIFALVLYMCMYGTGCSIPWIITSEIFPTKYRATATSFSTTIAYTLAFLISLSYLPFQQLVGPSSSFIPFISVSLICAIILYFILPETRGKSALDIVCEIRSRASSLTPAHKTLINGNIAFPEAILINGCGKITGAETERTKLLGKHSDRIEINDFTENCIAGTVASYHGRYG